MGVRTLAYISISGSAPVDSEIYATCQIKVILATGITFSVMLGKVLHSLCRFSDRRLIENIKFNYFEKI